MSTSRSDIAQSIASVEQRCPNIGVSPGGHYYESKTLDGERLPLQRSNAAIDGAAAELLTLFGRTTANVRFDCGIEQEFFLIERGWYKKRTDLMLTGRTLVGAPSPKKSIYHHRSLIARVSDLPNNLVWLPHEKPFAGVNGNGRHVVWSLCGDNRVNLFIPGDTAEENLLFLTLLVSVIHAVYRHGDLLRASAASAGNEERLGENGAPPAIMSVSLGKQLAKIITGIIESGKTEKGKKRDLADLGIFPLPKFTPDTIGSGSTSPFAFTGTGFEFRMPGSSTDISTVVTVINTIVADSIKTICDRIKKELGKSKGDKDADPQLSAAVLNVLSAVIKESKPVLFDGDNNSSEWIKEAQTRGLQNIVSAPEALKAFVTPKAVELFGRHKVFSEAELKDLYNARIDQYDETIDVEVKTLTDIVNTQILPAAYNYQADIASGLEVLRVLADDMTIEMTEGALEDRKEMFEKLTADIYHVRKNLKELAAMTDKAQKMEIGERAAYLFKEVKPQMNQIRRYVDALEGSMPDEIWPLPKYKEMLFIL